MSQAQASYSDTVAQNALSLKRARQAVTDAQAQLRRDRRAGAPAATLAQDRAAIRTAKQNLESAQLQARSGTRQAAVQITSAKQSLKSAQRSYRAATSSADGATLAADEVAIANAEAALAEASVALANATIVAPIDGTVTVVNIAVGSDAPSGTAIELQSAQLAITASFGEDDILSLEVGQQATVAVGATGETATGTVTAVSPVAATSGSSSVVTYDVTVTLDDAAAAAASSTTVRHGHDGRRDDRLGQRDGLRARLPSLRCPACPPT